MFPVAGCNPVDLLSRVAVKWFDSITLHQNWAASDNGSTGALHVSGRGSIPRRSTKLMESNAAGLVLRPALKTGFSEMGWGSTPLLSAKVS